VRKVQYIHRNTVVKYKHICNVISCCQEDVREELLRLNSLGNLFSVNHYCFFGFFVFKSSQFRNCHQLMLCSVCTYRKVGDVFRGLIPVCWILQGIDVGPLLFTNAAVFPLLDTEICVISSTELQRFLLMEKVETSERYDGSVLKDKICLPLKTVEYIIYMTCPPLYIEGSCVFNGFAPLDTRRVSTIADTGK
jgi:hypothetical protein